MTFQVDLATRDFIRKQIPDLSLLVDHEGTSALPNRDIWTVGPFESSLGNSEIDEVLSDDDLIRNLASHINNFTQLVLNHTCALIGQKNVHVPSNVSDDIDIFDQLFFPTEAEKKQINYHMPEFGRPRYMICVPELNLLYCESFDLLCVLYVEENGAKNMVIREYLKTSGLNILDPYR